MKFHTVENDRYPHPYATVNDIATFRVNRLIIIADDLTGAMDATGYLASRGLSVVVHMGRRFDLTEGINVINTDSRRDPAPVTSQKLAEIAGHLKGEPVFKKIDSTLRGNIAVEIKTVARKDSVRKFSNARFLSVHR